MDAVTRGTIASAVHRNSQDIDVLNGVVDKCARWFLVAVGELGAGSKAMKRCSKVLMLKEVAAGQRPRQQLRVVRRILARQAAAECIFGAGGQCFTTTTTTSQWTMACAVLQGAEISTHICDGTISKMPHILLNPFSRGSQRHHHMSVSSPLKPDLSQDTQTPHVIAVLLLWPDNILYANPDPFPCPTACLPPCPSCCPRSRQRPPRTE